MESNLTKWVEEEGQSFLKKIGIRKGYTVLDFGCGRGNYTIPISNVVGNIGIVYALDKNKATLSELEKIIAEKGIKNIELLNDIKDPSLTENSIDVVLCYDVLHYINISHRKAVYSEIRRILRKKAIFSVYPKHCKGNLPSRELADVSIGKIVKEIEDAGFLFIEEIRSKLLHAGSFEVGCVLNFRKGV